MSFPSSNNLYTIQSNMDMGINVRTQYIDSQGTIWCDPKDNYQILFFKNQSNKDTICANLNRWAGMVSANDDVSNDMGGCMGNDVSNTDIKFVGKKGYKDYDKNVDMNNERFIENKSTNLYDIVDYNTGNKEMVAQVTPENLSDPTIIKDNQKYFLTKIPIMNNRKMIINKLNPHQSHQNCYLVTKTFSNSDTLVNRNLNRYPNKLNNETCVIPNINNLENSCELINNMEFQNKRKNDNSLIDRVETFDRQKLYDVSDTENKQMDKPEYHQNNVEFRKSDKSIEECTYKNDNTSFNGNSDSFIKNKINKATNKTTYKPTSPTSINPTNDWHLSRLFHLFETFYLEGIYERDLISEFNNREQLILCKIIKVNIKEIPKLLGNKNQIAIIADKYFSNDMKRKGYKVTNNKRFVFRKIRSILYRNLQDPKTVSKASKKSRDNKFFLHYFQNAPEYNQLTAKERADVKSLLKTYEESKINVMWKFKSFTEDFSKVFFNFPQEMMKVYYFKKVCALKFCLEYMDDKSDEFIIKSTVPIKCLPRPLNVIKQYMADFFNSFGEYLVKE